jgi:exodeoxyribonuclease V alpha subunit
MDLITRLRAQPALRAVDLALADTLRRRGHAGDGQARGQADGQATDAHVLAGAALASLAVGLGHAAFDPARPQLLLPDMDDWPAADAWREALASSPWVSRPVHGEASDAMRPLVLEDGLLYLRRYREYEHRLASRLLALAAASTPVPVSTLDALAPLFATLFPHARGGNGGGGDGDRQAMAAALALRQRLLLVTGGPGTGKTTTIARVLLLLLAQARNAGSATPRIALAAPTGRAADRMAESLRAAMMLLRENDAIDPALCDALPRDASTLHRLLGTIPDSPRFRFNATTPLPFDVVVVDEASMVDLPLMCKLVEAVPDGARLILLGDRDQLPSVEAGDVLAAIGDAAGIDAPMPQELRGWFGDADQTPGTAGATNVGATSVASSFSEQSDDPQRKSSRLKPLLQKNAGLHGHRVQLDRGWRQSASLRLAPLADAIRAGDADHALALLRDAALPGVHFHENLADPLRGATREALLAPWRALQDCDDPREALRLASRVRLLTALRDGPQGAVALNARIEEALAGTQRAPYFHGRLLLVTENSYRHGLFNGDIGVCLRDGEGGLLAWFAGGDDGVCCFHPSALPAHGGAFAMTVHKAQGSEFDSVWLLLPRQDARALSRELLYTAITRARTSVHLCAGETALRATLSRHAQRVSGLSARLVATPVRG